MRKAEGAARSRALFADGLLERRDLGHGAVRRADRAADAGGVVRIDGKARIAQGVHAAEDLHLAEAVELAVEAELHIARAEILRRQLALNARRAVRLGQQLADARHADAALAGLLRRVRLFRENDAGVRAAECERVRHDVLQLALAGDVHNAVEVPGLFGQRGQILRGIARRRKNRVLRQCLDAEDGFDRARRAEAVARHGLRRADGRSRALEEGVQRQELRRVVLGRAGAVGIDVADVARFRSGVDHGAVQRGHLPLALRLRCSDVEGIRADAPARHLAVDLCAAADGVLILLHDQNTGALAEGDAVAVVQRRAGAGRERMQRIEARIGKG